MAVWCNSTTGMFMDKRLAAKQRFKLKKLERLLIVENINGMYKSRGAITHQVEVNVYYRNHVERMRIDVCDLGKCKTLAKIT